MEQARLTAYYASLVHSSGKLKIQDFGIFPWEDTAEYEPKFSKVDTDNFERFNAIQFPNSDN